MATGHPITWLTPTAMGAGGTLGSQLGQLPFILTQPANQTVYASSNATFSVVAAGVSDPLKLISRSFGQVQDIAGATDASLTLTNVGAWPRRAATR